MANVSLIESLQAPQSTQVVGRGSSYNRALKMVALLAQFNLCQKYTNRLYLWRRHCHRPRQLWRLLSRTIATPETVYVKPPSQAATAPQNCPLPWLKSLRFACPSTHWEQWGTSLLGYIMHTFLFSVSCSSKHHVNWEGNKLSLEVATNYSFSYWTKSIKLGLSGKFEDLRFMVPKWFN